MRRAPTLLLAVLAGSACSPPPSFVDVPVRTAALADADTNTVAVVVGYTGGDALLTYTDTSGRAGSLPVALRGGKLGLAVDVSLDLNPGATIALDLSEAEGEIWLSDLLTTYRGAGWGLTPGVGGTGHHLRSREGVRLDDTHFSAGVGVFGGFEWLRIREGGHEGQAAGVGTPADTADTADTGPGAWGDTAPAPEAAAGTGSGGCGCGSRGADSGAAGDGEETGSTDGGGDTSGGGAAEASADGAGCDGDGADCGGGDCGGSSLAPALFVLLLSGLRRRRGPNPPALRPGAGD